MIKIFLLTGVDLGIVLWLKELAQGEWSWYGFIQSICLLILSTMIYANIMKQVIELTREKKE